MRQPEATRPKKRIVAVDQFFRGVAGIDHAFARTAQRGFDFAYPFLHAVGGHGVAAVVLEALSRAAAFMESDPPRPRARGSARP